MGNVIKNSDYTALLVEVKDHIRMARQKAIVSVNTQMLMLYFRIGETIAQKQKKLGWGAKVIQKLAVDIKNELPEIKGFSERNIKLMVQFYTEYKNTEFGQLPVAQNNITANAQPLVAQIPWTHNVLLMQKIKDRALREWYMTQTLENGWSKAVLTHMIDAEVHNREAKLTSNFKQLMPSPDSDLVQQSFKDPYIFDFLTIDTHFRERELELNLVKNMEKFLLELGSGFAFVGRQYLLEIGDDEFYIDLLFYHLKLRCFVVIELKKGKFKPEYSGQVNFYCSAVDELLAQKQDKPTIGLILCQEKNEIVAEYSLKTTTQPIGISKYELTEILPKELESSLPTIEEIEAEFGGGK
ncbi:FIG074102: hypothetical protein [hydrothermal vent metagenome]|uniref:DUF1016 domain-containing protein n=1 Tax=hydrothermal vent metagenome TaxID=652676 RepID=A0A3B1B2A0_9ZZZZ